MENKNWLIFSIIVVIILGIFVIAHLLNKGQIIKTSPEGLANLPESPLTACNVIQDNGEDKVDVLFFSEETTARKYVDFFFTISPFKENQERFNFFYISDYKPECDLYKGIALLCYSKELTRKAASCPHDYIITVEKQPHEIRSSSFMNTISLNEELTPLVLPHEFAHAFATLADEYITGSSPPRKSKNCPRSCSGFGGIEDGCFEGCSESNRKRSIEEGIMRTLSSPNPTFGSFDEAILLEVINAMSTQIITETALSPEGKEYYLIELSPTEAKLSTYKIVRKTLEKGFATGAKKELNPILFTDGTTDTDETVGEVYKTIGKNVFVTIPINESSNRTEIFVDDDTTISTFSINLNDLGSRPCKNE